MGPRNHVLHGRPEVLSDVAMATNFRAKTAMTSFALMMATRQLVMEGVSVVGRQSADIANTLQQRDVAMPTIFWLSIYGIDIGAT